MSSAVAAAGVFALAVFAPFEMTTPLLRMPWQSLTNLEAVLALSIACWGAALAVSGRLPRLTTPLAPAWIALVSAMALAAALAPAERLNAWHMAGRFAAAAIVYFLTVEGVTSRSRLHLALALCVVTGLVVAALAMLEYRHVGVVLRALRAFRPAVTSVGDQVRAGGPLQYPTIASMYLEVVFAFGLGLMLVAIDARNRVAAAVWFVALTAIANAIMLTFTRAGLITMALSLAFVAALRLRQRGLEIGAGLVAALALVIAASFFSSRSAQSLWLRMTSEGQDSWYLARLDAPEDLSLAVGQRSYATVRATNIGRVTWDSDGESPIYLSYHWLDATGDRVVAYDGARTKFDEPVVPGGSATVHALVRAPRAAGSYRLEWDLVQEDRLWFSTEQGAPEPMLTRATVTGRSVGGPLPTRPRPTRAVRPGRVVLWRTALRMATAHPVAGVGPDNFRLLYGDYAGLANADKRTHSNNMYLEVLVGGGLIAAAAFAWLLRDTASLIVFGCKGSDPNKRAIARSWAQTPLHTPVAAGIAAAAIAIAVHGTIDSFLSFAPTYILFSLTLGFAAAVGRGVETAADAHRV